MAGCIFDDGFIKFMLFSNRKNGDWMSDHDRDKIMRLAGEYGKLGRQQCEHCRRRDEIVDELITEFIRANADELSKPDTD